MKKDKIKHLIVGLALGFGLSIFIVPFFAFFFTALIGAGKEYLDAGLPLNHWLRKTPIFSTKNTGFDNYDFFATALGGLIAVLIYNL